MLVNCVACQDGKRLGEIQPDEIHRYLAMPGCVGEVDVCLFHRLRRAKWL